MSTTKAGPGAGIAALYADHHRWLHGWLRRRLGDSWTAADLAHDTFVRVLGKDASLVIREPRALLTTIADGLVLNLWRHQRIEQAYLDALAQMPQAVAPSPEDRAVVLEMLVEVDRLLDGLPPLSRQVFLLSQLDGLRQHEIATRLGVSVPTVKRHLARAVAHCCFA